MRTRVPTFNLSFSGPDGPYAIHVQPLEDDDWAGRIDVSIRGVEMQWSVEEAVYEDGALVLLGGMTSGSKPLWNDEFWFEVRLDDNPPVIRYYGDQVLWREDRVP